MGNSPLFKLNLLGKEHTSDLWVVRVDGVMEMVEVVHWLPGDLGVANRFQKHMGVMQ